MKKLIAFFSAITFLGTSTLAVSACGVSKGQEIKVEINNVPKKAEDGQDPLTDYVYNNTYNYNASYVIYLTALAAQLASDKIYYDDGKTLNDDNWKQFYASTEWRTKSFSSFNYADSENSQGFSYQDSAGTDFIYQINKNDASVDANKLRMYWFITSATPWSADSSYQPTKNNITIPSIDDFKTDKEIIQKQGYVHFYLVMGNYQIDFSVQITFYFGKVIDKNKQPTVVLNLDTFSKPLGNIKFDDRETAANDKIVNLTLSPKPATSR